MTERETSGWAVGWATFAALMMIMIGFWHAIAGLVALFENEFYVVGHEYVFQLDVTTWGWIHLILGVRRGPRRRGTVQRCGVGQDNRRHPGGGQRRGSICLASLLPDLGRAHRRLGYLRDLGVDGSRPGYREGRLTEL